MAAHSSVLGQQRGITLVEAMIVVAIVAIVVGIGLPSLGALGLRAELAGAAAQVETDLQFARSQAVALNRNVQVTLREANGATCYMVHTGPAVQCECGGQPGAAPRCDGNAELLRAVHFAASDAVQVRAASKSVTFDAMKGTVTPTATIRIEARDGRTLHQVVNLLGRIRTCSPDGKVASERRC